jgi:hypothetical protein
LNYQRTPIFQVKFTAKNLTGNAGVVHLGKFADKLQLAFYLEKIYLDRTRAYSELPES